LEGLLEIMCFEMTGKSVGARRPYTFEELEGVSFKFLGAATLKLRAPNEVRTNATESRVVFDNLRQRVG